MISTFGESTAMSQENPLEPKGKNGSIVWLGSYFMAYYFIEFGYALQPIFFGGKSLNYFLDTGLVIIGGAQVDKFFGFLKMAANFVKENFTGNVFNFRQFGNNYACICVHLAGWFLFTGLYGNDNLSHRLEIPVNIFKSRSQAFIPNSSETIVSITNRRKTNWNLVILRGGSDQTCGRSFVEIRLKIHYEHFNTCF
ncbi:hypothetical protein PGUG_01350 [Meyerozyma guilliermondii ATCC 6260]|uniref:Uncharacterized protein n=1 Tax=Meyerozyma guilliermondii (strain ATCC 6260 / CBS 566 / DSM 6381 / JCM 1539 / NBRC 10279 / NRRL Y-324) TaxID=294746 RepID=A5DDJ9_PICGU|nr:uncharacterized protein PGUG_01350 [Meyerozyma guilliermondii ATCC 6260]EDK37252.2 hypothetical protein PGUG_01350 [Meyerozyma guilliermondii ATCC 6260]